MREVPERRMKSNMGVRPRARISPNVSKRGRKLRFDTFAPTLMLPLRQVSKVGAKKLRAGYVVIKSFHWERRAGGRDQQSGVIGGGGCGWDTPYRPGKKVQRCKRD